MLLADTRWRQVSQDEFRRFRIDHDEEASVVYEGTGEWTVRIVARATGVATLVKPGFTGGQVGMTYVNALWE